MKNDPRPTDEPDDVEEQASDAQPNQGRSGEGAQSAMKHWQQEHEKRIEHSERE